MRPGDIVTVRDEIWTVARTETFPHCTLLTLEGRGPGNTGRLFCAVAPFERISASQLHHPRRRTRRAVLGRALGVIAQERPALGLWTVAAANLDLLAYQLEPALAVLRGATRVLLADGVGLGKTIQAGLILAELRVRALADRTLILCPAGLRETWASELRQRFGITAAVLDQASIAVTLQGLPADINPWAAHPVIVASIDLVKRPEVLAAVEAVAFDLVIADEAHHLTPASERGHAVNRLASRAPWLVLVSATPHSGDQAAFSYMTATGSLGDPLVVFRRGRRDIGLPEDRRARLMSVVPTDDEARLLHATDDYAREIWQVQGGLDPSVQLVAITLARRAASSASALAQTLARRRALLSETPPPAPRQASLPWDEVDEDDGDEPDDRLGLPGMANQQAERARLDELIELARLASARSSKLRRLQRFLARIGEPAVVFTEYRDTLQAAADVLASRFRVGSIHGGVPAAMRHEVVRRFESGDLDVLLATDTAGEGLNLHRRCRLVVNLELPWNPLRLEQRVGRVDRLGQQRRVHAVHLLHRGTVEDRVWRHLERRRLRASHALADHGALTVDDVARAVFDEVALPSAVGSTLTSARIEAAANERDRVVELRRLLPYATATFDRPVFALPRRQDRSAAIAIFERTHLANHGGLVERRVNAVVVHLREVRSASAWRELAINLHGTGETSGTCSSLQPMRVAVLARIAAARSLLAAAPAMHQGSLFDRRSERAAGARRETGARLDAALVRRAASLSLAEAAPAYTRLVALWPLRLEP